MSLAGGVGPPPIPPTYPSGELWAIEVGSKAALRTESLQRDMRWFKGLDWKGQK